jgi:hypothetical protein
MQAEAVLGPGAEPVFSAAKAADRSGGHMHGGRYERCSYVPIRPSSLPACLDESHRLAAARVGARRSTVEQ